MKISYAILFVYVQDIRETSLDLYIKNMAAILETSYFSLNIYWNWFMDDLRSVKQTML